MSEEHKKVYKVLNHIENLLIWVSARTGCVSICFFSLIIDINIGIASPAVGLKLCIISV